MNIEILRKKANWELKAIQRALTLPISTFLNSYKDIEKLKNVQLVLQERRLKNIKPIINNLRG